MPVFPEKVDHALRYLVAGVIISYICVNYFHVRRMAVAPLLVNIFLHLMITSQFDQHEKIVRLILNALLTGDSTKR